MSTKKIYLLGFFMVCALLGVSAYLQIVDGILPCPLCSLQRIAFGLFGVIFLAGFLTYRYRIIRIIVDLAAIMAAGLGILFSGRQVWLQNFPPLNGEECGVSLQYMMQVLPINQVFQKVILEGTSECTKRGWEFLTINMAEWSLICFAVLLVLASWVFYLDIKRK